MLGQEGHEKGRHICPFQAKHPEGESRCLECWLFNRCLFCGSPRAHTVILLGHSVCFCLEYICRILIKKKSACVHTYSSYMYTSSNVIGSVQRGCICRLAGLLIRHHRQGFAIGCSRCSHWFVPKCTCTKPDMPTRVARRRPTCTRHYRVSPKA